MASLEAVRQRIYEIVTSPRPDDRLGRAISFGLMLLIATNVVASILETDAEIRARAPGLFANFERVSLAVFTTEYVLRVWSCTVDPRFSHPVTGRLRMLVTPMLLVDFLAIGPTYVDLFLPGTLDLRFLRVLRLMRLFRLFRFGRLGGAFMTLVRVIQAKRTELGVTLAFVAVATVVAAGAIYWFEHDEPDTQFTSIPRAMWWSIVTITTVGYGDMVPQTMPGHLIGAFVAFVGICALALPVGILSSGFIEELARAKAEPAPTAATCPHCGGEL